MICETNLMQQLWFSKQPLAQHVSGTIMSFFRSAGPYITAYGFQHLMCWLVSWEASKQALCTVHCVHGLLTCFLVSQDTSKHIKCRKPYAVIYGIALIKIGIMMTETCWANGLLINHNCCIYLVSHVISYKGKVSFKLGCDLRAYQSSELRVSIYFGMWSHVLLRKQSASGARNGSYFKTINVSLVTYVWNITNWLHRCSRTPSERQ